MDSITIVEEAIAELKLQQKLIKKQASRYDPTLYRSWVSMLIPKMLPVMEKTLYSLNIGESEKNVIEEILLAYQIVGKRMLLGDKKIETPEQYLKYTGNI